MFFEVPHADEMARYCREVDGPKMVNNLAGGLTPSLPLAELREMGFSLSAYPLDLLAASIVAQRAALEGLREGAERHDDALPFDEMQEAVGFGEYYREEARASSEPILEIILRGRLGLAAEHCALTPRRALAAGVGRAALLLEGGRDRAGAGEEEGAEGDQRARLAGEREHRHDEAGEDDAGEDGHRLAEGMSRR